MTLRAKVTGQGVQNFFVATPGLGTTSGAAAMPPVITQPSPYGY